MYKKRCVKNNSKVTNVNMCRVQIKIMNGEAECNVNIRMASVAFNR